MSKTDFFVKEKNEAYFQLLPILVVKIWQRNSFKTESILANLKQNTVKRSIFSQILTNDLQFVSFS